MVWGVGLALAGCGDDGGAGGGGDADAGSTTGVDAGTGSDVGGADTSNDDAAGDDTTSSAPAPALLRLGWDSVCVLASNRLLRCASEEDDGSYGAWEAFDEIGPVVEVALWGAHTCALGIDRAVWCWGSNTLGALGDGTEDSRETPAQVMGLESLGAVTVSGNHSCTTAIDPELGRPTVTCWGANTDGQLGDCSDDFNRTTPWSENPCLNGWSFISALTDPSTIRLPLLEAGGKSTCAAMVASDPFGAPLRSIYCYGDNEFGQLGTGDNQDANSPRAVQGLGEARTLSLGERHACASTAVGDVYCWGDNAGGQLGIPGLDDSNTPALVAGVRRVMEVSAGSYHTCARLEDGTVSCWGAGQLAAGGFDELITPRLIPGLTGVVDLDSAGNKTCALLNDGSARCWVMRFSPDLPEPEPLELPVELASRAAVEEEALDPDPATLPLCERACGRLYQDCGGSITGSNETECVELCESQGGTIWQCIVDTSECQALTDCN